MILLTAMLSSIQIITMQRQSNVSTTQFLKTSTNHYRQVEGVTYVVDNNEINAFSIAVSQVFKDLDFLGWYTTGNTANEIDLKVHQQASTKVFNIFRTVIAHLLVLIMRNAAPILRE